MTRRTLATHAFHCLQKRRQKTAAVAASDHDDASGHSIKHPSTNTHRLVGAERMRLDERRYRDKAEQSTGGNNYRQ